MLWIRGFALGALGWAAVVACGGSSNGGGGAGTSSSFVSSYCQVFSPCCAQAGKPSDGQQCTAFLGAFSSGYTYDPVAGEQCLAAVRAASAAPDFCSGQSASFDSSSCKGVFKSPGGAKQPGEPCNQTADCATVPDGDVSCTTHFENNTQTRVCEVRIDGKEGDTPCIGTKDGNITSYSGSSSASRGYVCDVAKGIACDSTSKTCTKLAGPGEACGSGHQCVKTAFCDFSTSKCVDRFPIGADCSKNSTACAVGSYCDTTAKKCIAQLDNGAACATSSQCKSGACVNKACDAGGSNSITLAFLCGT